MARSVNKSKRERAAARAIRAVETTDPVAELVVCRGEPGFHITLPGEDEPEPTWETLCELGRAIYSDYDHFHHHYSHDVIAKHAKRTKQLEEWFEYDRAGVYQFQRQYNALVSKNAPRDSEFAPDCDKLLDTLTADIAGMEESFAAEDRLHNATELLCKHHRTEEERLELRRLLQELDSKPGAKLDIKTNGNRTVSIQEILRKL
jgi:hypothetical protein